MVLDCTLHKRQGTSFESIRPGQGSNRSCSRSRRSRLHPRRRHHRRRSSNAGPCKVRARNAHLGGGGEGGGGLGGGGDGGGGLHRGHRSGGTKRCNNHSWIIAEAYTTACPYADHVLCFRSSYLGGGGKGSGGLGAGGDGGDGLHIATHSRGTFPLALRVGLQGRGQGAVAAGAAMHAWAMLAGRTLNNAPGEGW